MILRRLTTLLVILTFLSASGLAALPGSLAAQETPTIVVAPASGDQNQIFTFAGQGFAGGARLTVEMKSPDGQTFTLQKDGQPAVWVVSDQGTFVIEILPSRDFAGAAAGTWTANFCVEGTPQCWSGTFDIAL